MTYTFDKNTPTKIVKFTSTKTMYAIVPKDIPEEELSYFNRFDEGLDCNDKTWKAKLADWCNFIGIISRMGEEERGITWFQDFPDDSEDWVVQGVVDKDEYEEVVSCAGYDGYSWDKFKNKSGASLVCT